MKFNKAVCFFPILFSLSAACANKSSSETASAGSTGDKTSSLAMEKALWTTETMPLKLRCQPSSSLGFRLSDGLSPANRYMLARLAILGPGQLKFESAFLQDYFQKAGFVGVKLLENKERGVQGIVAYSERINLVVFRGTHDSQGVMTDLNFFMSSNSFINLPGGVHGGFKLAFDSIQPALNAALDIARRPGIPTFYVGHSLGGALAALAAVDGKAKGVKVEGLVTLGQPRTGTAYYVTHFPAEIRAKYVRYVHGNDPVPHLPPAAASAFSAATAFAQNPLISLGVQASSLLAFGHIGLPQELGKGNFAGESYQSDGHWDVSFWAKNGAGFSKSVSSVLSGAPSASLGSVAQNDLVSDHDVEKYLCGILEKVK